MPLLHIEARGVPGLPLTFIAAGEMANHFEESYGVSIDAKDKTTASASVTGQRPHPPDMNFDHGAFENTQFTVKLFSGMTINNKKVPGPSATDHSELTLFAERLYRLAMPRPSGDDGFIGPPLVVVQYAAYWRAIGLFQKVTCISEGGFDAGGYPSLMTLRMEFARHFGGNPTANGGVYLKAKWKQLKEATADKFSFKSRRR